MDVTNQDMNKFINKFKAVNFGRYHKTYTIDEKIVVFFTDGSCTGNGKNSSEGGYAAIGVNGFKKGLLLYGKVDGSKIKATNIRAEGIAIQSVFENLLKNTKSSEWDQAVIYSDSEFWIKMLYIYMPKWKATNFDVKANPDLTKKIWKLWQDLQKTNKTVAIKHVYAHGKNGGATSESVFERFTHDNNDLADMLAGIARELPDYKLREDMILE